MTERPEPAVDFPASEALENLTGFEIIAINKRTGQHVTDLDPVLAIYAAVWCYENRDGARRTWESVLALPARDIDAYFAEPEPFEDEDSPSGKDAPTPAT